MQSNQDEISLHEIVGVVKKRWKSILLPSMCVAIIVAGVSKGMPPKFESIALLRQGYKGNQFLENVFVTEEIMNSQPVLLDLFGRLKRQGGIEEALKLKDGVNYEELGGLMKIRAYGKTAAEAALLTQSAADIVIERHKVLYEKALKERDETVKYVGANVRPAIVSGGITDYKLEPTRVEMLAIVSKLPVKSKTQIFSVSAFFSMMMLMTLLAFYYEGKEK